MNTPDRDEGVTLITDYPDTATPERPDHSFLWSEDVDAQEWIEGYQGLIDSGAAWRLEGSVGRTAMALIEDGFCTLGVTDHFDFYGNHVPSRNQVVPGSMGTVEYVEQKTAERDES